LKGFLYVSPVLSLTVEILRTQTRNASFGLVRNRHAGAWSGERMRNVHFL